MKSAAASFPMSRASVVSLKFAQQIRPVPEGRNVYRTEIPENSEAPEERNIWFRVRHISAPPELLWLFSDSGSINIASLRD